VNKEKDDLKELNTISNKKFNGKLFVNEHPINFYFNHGRFFRFKADAIYDLQGDKWIKKPKALVEDDVEELIKGCASAKEFNEVLTEYFELRNLLESYHGQPEEIEKIIEQTLKVSNLFNRIRDVRREEFNKRKTDGLPSANFRCSNIIFKLLESYGLNDLATKVSDFLIDRLKT
jgi:hypothetical protein